MIRRLAARNHPTHVPQLVVGNVGEYLLLIEDHVVGPIRSLANPALGSADMLDGFRTVPDRRRSIQWRGWWCNTGRVIPPGQGFCLQQVGQRLMIKAWIDWGIGCFAAGWIDQPYRGTHGRVTAGVGWTVCVRIFRRKQIASGRWSRCTGNNELVCWKAGPLVGLEHAVG